MNTTDLSDKYSDIISIPEPIFGDFGGVETFSGSIVTVKTFEDNTLVRATLETPGQGRVLVVDGGGSMRCAPLPTGTLRPTRDSMPAWVVRGMLVDRLVPGAAGSSMERISSRMAA